MITSNLLERPIGRRTEWLLDPAVTFLNHGSFGACPKAVLEHQHAWQERLEREPVRFLIDDWEGLWDDARRKLSGFVGASTDDLVFVPNATTGVNTVLRSLRFRRGDELLVTDHEYNACRNVLDFVAAQSGARVIVAQIPFPLHSPAQVLQSVLDRVTRRTRLALLDHVTSPTGLVLPIAQLVRELSARDIETLVDGAHAPGMVPLNLRALGATYYTGNCHKWICAPKGAAFLHVQPERQRDVRPLVISHGANSNRRDRSRFLLEFGWMGTGDPSACLSVPEAIRVVGGMLPGGWPAVMQRNRALALAARRILCDALAVEPPCPEEMIGSLAAVPLPDMAARDVKRIANGLDRMRGRLLRDFSIEVPVLPWPAPPKRLVRVSAQLYNSVTDYGKLAAALSRLLRGKISRLNP